MEESSSVVSCLAIWILCLAVLSIAYFRKTQSFGVGILPAYCIGLSMMHWLAGAIFLLPWWKSLKGLPTAKGLTESTYGIVALTIGCLAYQAIAMLRHAPADPSPPTGVPEEPRDAARLASIQPSRLVMAGTICYVILTPLLHQVTSVIAILSMTMYLAMTGLCLAWWKGWRLCDRGRMRWALFGALLLPFINAFFEGFMSFGSVMLILVACFVASFYRPRRRLLLASVVGTYLLLSLMVTWLGVRKEVRAKVWTGQVWSDRFSSMADIALGFEFFDPKDLEHLSLIEGRFNQNWLIGLAVSKIDQTGRFADGETIVGALYALVPRIVWPDKPVQAGGGMLVTNYTGIEFAWGTSVGMGQVFEFYINFGRLGVLIGFLLYGFILSTLDHAARIRLDAGNMKGFLLFFLPTLGMNQTYGSLVEISVSAAAGLIVALLVVRTDPLLYKAESRSGAS